MVTACGRLDQLSRADCRRRFLEEFTIDSMVDRYEAVYQAAQANEPLPRVAAAAATAPSRSGAGG
jgi:hypothetical protein